MFENAEDYLRYVIFYNVSEMYKIEGFQGNESEFF